MLLILHGKGALLNASARCSCGEFIKLSPRWPWVGLFSIWNIFLTTVTCLYLFVLPSLWQSRELSRACICAHRLQSFLDDTPWNDPDCLARPHLLHLMVARLENSFNVAYPPLVRRFKQKQKEWIRKLEWIIWGKEIHYHLKRAHVSEGQLVTEICDRHCLQVNLRPLGSQRERWKVTQGFSILGRDTNQAETWRAQEHF